MSFLSQLSLKKKSKDISNQLTSESPYLNARRTWNSHVGGLMSAVQIWQFIGLTSLLVGLASVGGMIYIGSQSKFVPLIFQQDGGGNILSVTRADRIPEAKVDDYRTAAFKFIENIRVVTADADLQRKAVLQTYSFLAAHDPATLKANDYLNASPEVNPFNRARSEIVHVEIRSVLQQTKESWQVDWLETIRNRDGSLKQKPRLMRAIVNLYQKEPTNETTNVEALRNPHFIFVRDFNWSIQL
ncbi:VirB8/TrbF family protein [Legionella fairfieldensis]|uniref:VirB8/TrbF family protein n=1 Tax=Legionella fairfieldensis TaxID=45064 RepID=UPI00048F2C2E|nr:VirB8/TrbF family protein [Legionella fairfieldensis]